MKYSKKQIWALPQSSLGDHTTANERTVYLGSCKTLQNAPQLKMGAPELQWSTVTHAEMNNWTRKVLDTEETRDYFLGGFSINTYGINSSPGRKQA